MAEAALEPEVDAAAAAEGEAEDEEAMSQIFEDDDDWALANESIQDTWARFVSAAETAGIRSARTWTPQFVSYPILPPDGKTFRENFIGNDDNIKYTNVLYKRLAGLISYYKGSKPEYMARVNRDTISPSSGNGHKVTAHLPFSSIPVERTPG